MKPLAIDLFTGIHGWGAGLVAEGYRVVGFDIVDMCKAIGYPRIKGVELVLQDVLTLHGKQFASADLIVASPPCQFFSYCAMPWSRAKALAAEVRADPVRLEKELALFNACFRIQREACEAAGRHIPMVVENVKGAEAWVGKAAAKYGSFYLWADAPILMPFGHHRKLPPDVSANIRDGRSPARWTNPAEHYYGGLKVGGDWFRDPECHSAFSSRSSSRKAASAMIARIPLPIARWIAWYYHPDRIDTPAEKCYYEPGRQHDETRMVEAGA